jgi:hypothetical protein
LPLSAVSDRLGRVPRARLPLEVQMGQWHYVPLYASGDSTDEACYIGHGVGRRCRALGSPALAEWPCFSRSNGERIGCRSMSAPVTATPQVPSGVPGLDEVLQGGLPRGMLLLVEGPPGSGKPGTSMKVTIGMLKQSQKRMKRAALRELSCRGSRRAPSAGWRRCRSSSPRLRAKPTMMFLA